MIHVGVHEYYEAILTRLYALENHKYLVLYEMIAGNIIPEKLTPQEKEIYEQIMHMGIERKEITDLLQLQNQKDGIPLKSSWINTDITLYDLIKEFAAKNVSFGDKNKPFNLKSDEKEIGRAFLNMVFVNLPFMFFIIKIIKPFLNKKTREELAIREEIILGKRNAVAYTMTRNHLSKDIAMTWGAAHLPGLVEMLQLEGYHVHSYEWVTSIKKKFSFRTALIETLRNKLENPDD